MTNSSGSQIESTNYMPFGGMRAHSGTTTSNYKYTDQELDAENGLYNYDARMYDPIIGRFISPDTIVPEPYNPQSLNRYTYCLNNPLIYVDPSGYVLADINADGHIDPDESTLDEIEIIAKRMSLTLWALNWAGDINQNSTLNLFPGIGGVGDVGVSSNQSDYQADSREGKLSLNNIDKVLNKLAETRSGRAMAKAIREGKVRLFLTLNRVGSDKYLKVIYLQIGQPINRTVGIIAHEFTHIFDEKNWPMPNRETDPLGFALATLAREKRSYEAAIQVNSELDDPDWYFISIGERDLSKWIIDHYEECAILRGK
jgi:RHS repeat-associated protein